MSGSVMVDSSTPLTITSAAMPALARICRRLALAEASTSRGRDDVRRSPTRAQATRNPHRCCGVEHDEPPLSRSKGAPMPRRPPSLPAPVRGLVAALVAVLLAGCQSAHPGAESIEAEQPPVAEPWAWELPDCVGYRAADYRAPAQRQQVRVRSRSDRTEQVEIYQPGWGERAFAEIRRVLRECARYEA